MTIRLRDRVFAALYRCALTFDRAATLWYYAAAGVTRLADLRAAIRQEWDEAEASSGDDIAFGLMRWEREFYLRFLKPEERVLVVGSGAGRDLLALLQLGYRAAGVDVSARFTATARAQLQQRGWDAPLYTGAIEATAVPGQFDAVIFSWFCYSYIPQSATRIHALRELGDHLDPGGRILVTYVPAEGSPRRLPIGLARLAARVSRSDWRPEYGDTIHLADRGRYFQHYEHQFTREALEEEARAAGLTVVFHERGEVGTAVLIP
jgi:SAM-dependent methyltransferase